MKPLGAHWIYSKLNIKFEKVVYKKSGWKKCYKLGGFSRFPKYVYIRSLLDYDHNMKKWNHINTY